MLLPEIAANQENPGSYTSHPGRQCAVSHETAAKGICYHDSFGDWHRTMMDPMHLKYDEFDVAPPR